MSNYGFPRGCSLLSKMKSRRVIKINVNGIQAFCTQKAFFSNNLRKKCNVGTDINKICCCHPYGTWALTSFSHLNSNRIQPLLEIENVLADLSEHEDVINKRNSTKKPDISKLPGMFDLAKQLKQDKETAEKARDENSTKVQTLLKALTDKKTGSTEVKELRDKGKALRDELRTLTNKFNEANDNVVNLVLSIPNKLDPMTPLHKYEILRDFGVKEGVDKFRMPQDVRWEFVQGVGPYAEYAIGDIALLELDLAAKCQKFLLPEKFSETGNVDFVKRTLLDGPGLDPNQFLRIRETSAKTGKGHATYLVGGATFPAFLALFAQSVIQDMSALPIKFFVIGRSYNKGTKVRSIQNTAVQVFVACKDEEQQEEEFMKLAQLMEKFYSEVIGVSAQSRLLAAPEIRAYEKKKIAFVVDESHKTVGDLATVGDYVSKRLLCCYNEKRIPKFLHLITGQFFNITNFLRPLLPTSKESNASSDGGNPKVKTITTDLPQILPAASPAVAATVTNVESTTTSPSSATTTGQSSTKLE